MTEIPKLKRIKVASARDLEKWLSGNAELTQSVMLVTQVRPSSPKHISREQLRDALAAHGWVSERSYNLNATLVGHVIHSHTQAASR